LKRFRAAAFGAAGRELSSDVAARGFHVAQSSGSRGDRSGQPAAEVLIGAWRLAAWSRVRCDRPRVTRSPASLSRSLARHKPRFLHPLEVKSDPVGVQVQALSEFDRPRRAPQLAEQREQTRACGLGEHVLRIECEWGVHAKLIYTL
jgi:hypothetical protein